MSDLLLKDLNSLKGFFTDPVFVAEDNSVQQMEPVETKNVETPIEVSTPFEPPINFKLIGSYQRGLLILVNDAHNDVSNEEGKTLLKNILKFLKVNTEDFGILNLHNYPEATIEHLKQQLDPKKIFAFGIPEKFLALEVGKNYIQNNGLSFFLGAALTTMATDIESKKLFNQSLKNYTL